MQAPQEALRPALTSIQLSADRGLPPQVPQQGRPAPGRPDARGLDGGDVLGGGAGVADLLWARPA
ncbi:hypothetical protein, partial [Streptomyces sp. CC77]|uniref:hypothetical protein n=1 Tax=Streptomyces sp. CC77 TaxID=1906739 RepID=UPI001C31550C